MKVIKLIKSNLLGFIIGGLIFGSITGVVAINLTASDIPYTSNTTVANALDKLKYASNKPVAYWYSTTQYAIGNAPTALYLSGTSTGHNAYIGSTSEKHYACTTKQGKEVCLSQPYTQYGLEGHTLESDFTTTQQTNAKNAIFQVFNDAGINIDISSCYAGSNYIGCRIGGWECYVDRDGGVDCDDTDAGEYCRVFASGDANCA